MPAPNVMTDFHVRVEGVSFSDLSREKKVEVVEQFLTNLASEIPKDSKVASFFAARTSSAYRTDRRGTPEWATPKVLLPWVALKQEG
jgi:hypothetical protein